ncbi:MAG: hypothetical protein ACOWYE_06425 [Desulfatiglandales bacterium]
MGTLQGLQDYLDTHYHVSVFKEALDSKGNWTIHLHRHRIIGAKILENLTYDIRCGLDEGGEERIPKVEVKMLYPAHLGDTVKPLIKTDRKVLDLALEPLYAPHKRYHIKNKSLFPLMHEKEVLFFTLMEGEVIKGIISAFCRYEITVNMKGGIPVTILRHGICDLRNKKGRCFLKSSQDKFMDWEKSPLYIPS